MVMLTRVTSLTPVIHCVWCADVNITRVVTSVRLAVLDSCKNLGDLQLWTTITHANVRTDCYNALQQQQLLLLLLLLLLELSLSVKLIVRFQVIGEGRSVSLQAFLDSNDMMPPMQSAYRRFHSAETAVTTVYSDLC